MIAFSWTIDRIVAIIAGSFLCGFLYAFFFGRRRRVRAAVTDAGAQQVTIAVSGGYDPDVVVAKKGVPLRLIFDRREANPCSDEVILPEFEVRRALPAFAKTTIEVIPKRAGEFPFSCGMNMLHGTIKVVE
ncbi:MAG TPA: cupredoxin domain-containing protein [Thermoanaerobaculia bacterium]